MNALTQMSVAISQEEDAQSTSESLIEALENIKVSKGLVPRPTWRGSPHSITDPDRLTDYPGHSASPDSALSRSPCVSSHRSSISTISESSLTSEGSFSAEMSRKPGKNILKRSHGQHRRSKNRVRWNLPVGEVSDSDNTSLESFDSSTAGSMVYQRARNSVAESRKNWREFEQSPSHGSTGLTPTRHFHSVSLPSPIQHHGYPYNMWSPSHSPGPPFEGLQSSPLRVSAVAKSEPPGSRTVGRFRQSPLFSNSPPKPLPAGQRSNSITHSTPVQRCSSDTTVVTTQTGYYNSRQDRKMNLQSGTYTHMTNGLESPRGISPLKLDHSNLSELEASTLDERHKRHLFEFPQPHSHPKQSQRMSTLPAYSGIITRPSAGSFEDDADDYDHLSPCTNEKGKDGTGPMPLDDIYCEKDIDEALEELEYEKSGQESQLTNEVRPPPLPPRRRHSSMQREELLNKQQGTVPHHNGLLTEDSRSSMELPRELVSPGSQNQMANKQSQFDSQDAPPVPLKKYRICRVDRDQDGNPHYPSKGSAPLKGKYKPLPPLPEDSQQTSRLVHSSTLSKQQEAQLILSLPHGDISADVDILSSINDAEDILPPPPEFAATSERHSQSNELGSDGDLSQPLSSVSNSTLIGDQEEPSPTSSRKNVKPKTTSLGELKEPSLKQTKLYQYQSSRGDVTRIPVHPTPQVHSLTQSLSWHPDHSVKSGNQVTGKSNNHHRSPPQGNLKHTLHTGPALPAEGYTVKLVQTTVQANTKPSLPSPMPNLRPNHAIQYPNLHTQGKGQPPAKPAQKEATTNAANSPIPRYKKSLEPAFTEGNLLKNTNYTSAHTKPRHRRTSEGLSRSSKSPANSQEGRNIHLRRTTSSSHHPQPIHPANVITHFSPEEQQFLQTFCSSQKPPTMKPVIHDTATSIEQMMAELESDGSEDERRSCGKLTTVCIHLHVISIRRYRYLRSIHII